MLSVINFVKSKYKDRLNKYFRAASNCSKNNQVKISYEISVTVCAGVEVC